MQTQVLCVSDGITKIVCIFKEEDRFLPYYLYEKTWKSGGKWKSRLVGKYKDFQHMLYIVGHMAETKHMFDD